MIERLSIQNFKSIKKLDYYPKRVNVLIGEPNTGKSNILEALGFLSGLHYASNNFTDFVRFESVIDFFFNQSANDRISILSNDITLTVLLQNNLLVIDFLDYKKISGVKSNTIPGGRFDLKFQDFPGGWDPQSKAIRSFFSPIKYYSFKSETSFSSQNVSFLDPPYGNNLAALANANQKVLEAISTRFNELGYEVLLEPYDNKISILSRQANKLVKLPYRLASDSFRRIAFFHSAIVSNTDSTLIFEEPESNIFPYYINLLAESIGLDTGRNQYFIATHNPYFLMSVIEKTPKDDLSVNVTFLKENETKIKTLDQKQVESMFDLEHTVFFNLENFLPEDSK